MNWMIEMGYREAHETPSRHGSHCRGELLTAQEDDDDSTIFLYCDNCRQVWRIGRFTQSMATRQYMFAVAERLYSAHP